MQFAQGVLTHTPLWVFAFFVYLVWQGILSLRSRELPIWRLLVVPALFMILGISRIALRQQGEWPVVCWLIGLALLAPLGFATGPRILSIDRANARITRSGSRIPLIRNIVVFALQYGFRGCERARPRWPPNPDTD